MDGVMVESEAGSSSVPLDLTACSREPIHIPGAIQPHGVLVSFDEATLQVLQVSENCAQHCGVSADEVLRGGVQALLGEEQAEAVRTACQSTPPESPVPLQTGGSTFDGILHRSDGVAILELEPSVRASEGEFLRTHHALTHFIARLQSAADLPALCNSAAEAVAQLTGFHRVMVYRFDSEWNGEVIAEVKAPELEPYLGLHYPASDIPEQARRLYLKSWLRLIASSAYQPAALTPLLNPITGRPLDLSLSTLRSVSPVHLEYLRNMGVQCSMSISLIRDERLWGLIACHHGEPRILPYARRAACELLGQIMSAQLLAKEEALRHTENLAAREVQLRFFDYLSAEENFIDALVKYTPTVLEFLSATGAAICVDGECMLLGETPSKADVCRLVEIVRTQPHEAVFHTDVLHRLHPGAAAYQDVASGLLAVALSELKNDYLVWFRPEVVRTVAWAGNPQKPAEDDGHRLAPRKSFALWKEQVTGRSRPWQEAEVTAALELRSAINALIFKRADRLRRLNEELERKNSDLDSFAYIAAHDLTEPLRGIRNYATFLMEDIGEKIDADSRRKLETVESLSERMQEMLEALLHFTRVGRRPLLRNEADLGEVVQEAMELIAQRVEESGATLEVKAPLPRVRCDPVLLREVFTNLVVNAIKYNQSAEKRVTIGVLPERDATGKAICFVRDNGIGIAAKHLKNVFVIFRRLHLRDQFGGGFGAGLAVVKSIVERHGGRVWVESQPGEGATFFFTLESIP
jgi:light-regulated signal transduction histidine kinase (bacteriophytochrome)